MFDFGENWQKFSEDIRRVDYVRARESLKDLAGELNGRTFLDVGCGSGLFSAAANSLGAREVTGIDVDPVCIAVSVDNLEKIKLWDKKIDPGRVKLQEGSILSDCRALGVFDVVYSWGVLHHTGNMYKGFNNIIPMVKENGDLIIAIYNKHFTSGFWKAVKRLYNAGPEIVKSIMLGMVFAVKFIGIAILQRKNPLKKERGMNFYRDIKDWVGGYPYEYASVDEIVSFFENKGFETQKVIRTKGFTGCNEFVFRKTV